MSRNSKRASKRAGLKIVNKNKLVLSKFKFPIYIKLGDNYWKFVSNRSHVFVCDQSEGVYVLNCKATTDKGSTADFKTYAAKQGGFEEIDESEYKSAFNRVIKKLRAL